MKTVALDTNFLILACRLRIDLAGELERLLEGAYELVTSSRAVDEMRFIARSKRKEAGAARFALEFVERKVRVEKSDREVDDWILEMAEKATVCTNDFELARKAKKKGKVIIVRGKTHLEFF